MNLPLHVISLPGSNERQAFIAGQLEGQGLPFSWLDGVNGRALDAAEKALLYSEEKAVRQGGRALSPGEVGCALSHLKAYRTFLDSGAELALVLEDDAALRPDFRSMLEGVVQAVDWQETDLLLLSHVQKYTEWGARPLVGDLRLVHTVTAYNGNGYLITRRGAEALLRELQPVFVPADSWNYLRKRGVLRIRAVIPYLVNHSTLSVDSVIGNIPRAVVDHPFLTRLWKGLKRVVYEKFLYQILVKPLLRIRKQPVTW